MTARRNDHEPSVGGDGVAYAPMTLQERVVERQLSAARARALARSSRFLAAALELVEESGPTDFTVQRLVERSNLSLRAFYEHFSGKEELLLALYENVASQFTDTIRLEVSRMGDPMGRLEAFCRGYLARAESSHARGGRAMTVYTLGLEVSRPEQLTRVWGPHRKLLTSIMTDCATAGLVRHDLTPSELAVLLDTTLTALAQVGVLDLQGDDARLGEDQLWAWCRQAVSPLVEESGPAAAGGPATQPPRTTRGEKS